MRIKDITSLRGARDNQLIGYGLVVGLQGTGDTLRNAPFTEQAIQSMLDRMGVNVHGAELRNRNVAAVIVTADLPAGMDVGSRLDVTVSALGDAPSLMGGTLLLTQMTGADGQPYASAQGAVSVTGFDAAGQAETLSQGVPTAGRIPNGAIIERAVPAPPDELRHDPRTEKSRLQRPRCASSTRSTLIRSSVSAVARRSRSTAGASSCSARRKSASRVTWRRSAN